MKVSDRQLIKFSLIIFIIFFCVILYIDNNYELEETKIKDLSLKDINKYVKIESKILNQRINNGTLFLTIGNENKSIPAVLFNYDDIELNLSYNYFFTGKITYYKNDIELILYKIEKNN